MKKNVYTKKLCIVVYIVIKLTTYKIRYNIFKNHTLQGRLKIKESKNSFNS
jgi:hypothetical protein